MSRDAYTFDMQTFASEQPEVLRGKLDIGTLDEGTYQCTVKCRLVTGDELLVRDFSFSVTK